MSIRNKTKGVKMKKVALAVAVVLGFIVIQPVQASNQKALVIIDSHFDSKVSSPNIKCITTKNTDCVPTSVTSSALSSTVNHGNAMAEVAKGQSSTLPIILLQSASVNSKAVNTVNAGNFIDALNWVNNNSSNIGAVSVSVFFNGTKTCSPNSNNTAPYGGVGKADQTIRSLITTLKTKNIPVFVATGNVPQTKVGYPACINDTVSVTSPGNLSDAFTDVSASLDTDKGIFNFKSPVFGLIPQTTSSVTVAVATQYLSTGSLPAKSVRLNP
jgi:hypothetical protein